MKNLLKELTMYIVFTCFVIIATYIAFYDKVPTIKNLPETREYTRTEEIKQFLGEQVNENSSVITTKTYEVSSSELSSLQKKNIYEEGKSNPFGDYDKESDEEEKNSNPNTTSSSQKNFSHSNTIEK